MDYMLLIIIVCSLIYINAQTASPKVLLQSGIYYVNQSTSISCDSGFSTDLASVAITINNTQVLFTITCEIINARWHATKLGDAADNCDNFPGSGNINLFIRKPLTESMVSSTVTCEVKYIDGRRLKSKSDSIANAFSDPYIAPTRLEFDKFEFDDNVPVLNKKMRAHCVSYGGYPESQFIYEVRNTSDSTVYSTTEVKNGAAEFTIDHGLKKGFKVTCRDKVHTEGEIYLTRQNCSGSGSEVCTPWFVEIPSDVSRYQKPVLNPRYSNSFKCAVEGHPADKITYSWTSGGVLSTTSATHNIDADFRKNRKTETLTCTASLDKYGNEIITWEITWSLKATTDSVPTSPANSSASLAIGVGVGVGVAVIIIAVVVGVILYKKKKDNSRRLQSIASHPVSAPVERSNNNWSPQATDGGYLGYYKTKVRVKRSKNKSEI